MISIYLKDRKELRNWYRKNHKNFNRFTLIYYKKHTGKNELSTSEAMNEGICWGWIDTTLKRLDDERYCVQYVKRNNNSRWSNATLRRAREQIKNKKMTSAGMKAYELGLTKPVIDHNLPKNPEIPEVLKKEFDKKINKKAKENFEKFPPSAKRLYLYWILTAKRPETIKKRVKETIERSRENRRM